jgi:hypothetical protein
MTDKSSSKPTVIGDSSTEGSTQVPQNSPPTPQKSSLTLPIYRLNPPTVGQKIKRSKSAQKRQNRILYSGVVLFLVVLPFSSLLFRSTNKASTLSSSPSVPENASSRDSVIAQADNLIQQDKLINALQLLQNVPGTDSKRNEIIVELFNRAQKIYPADLEVAVYILQNIPSGSEPYNQSQTRLANWKLQLNSIQAAEFALKQKDFAEVQAQLRKIENTPVADTDRYKAIATTLQENSTTAPNKNQ